MSETKPVIVAGTTYNLELPNYDDVRRMCEKYAVTVKTPEGTTQSRRGGPTARAAQVVPPPPQKPREPFTRKKTAEFIWPCD